MTDCDLLRRYSRTGSEQAFAELVGRHIDMVYSVCLRRLRNRADAEDATQAVFIALSDKASAMPRGTVLGGWLYRATGYVASDVARKARRRKEHEMASAFKQDLQPQPDPAMHDVDAVLARLSAGDRHAVVLRYLEGRSFKELAAEMRLTEEAARKRVSRALERMRGMLRTAEGGAFSLGLVEKLLSGVTQPAPTGLVHLATKAALTGWSTSSGGASLAKGVVLAIALSKTQTLLLGAGMLLFVVGGTVGMYYYTGHRGPNVVVIDKPDPQSQIKQPSSELWQSRFYEVYALQSGEDVKAVVPPLGWERQMFFMDDCRKKGLLGWKLGEEELITLEWDGVTDHWRTIGGNPDLEAGLLLAAELKPYQLDSSIPLKLPFPGDWVVRKGTSTDRRMAGIAKIMSKKLGRAVRFEKRSALREVLEVRGAFRETDRIVEMTDGISKALRQDFAQQASLENFLELLSNRLGVKLESHVEDPGAAIRWHDGTFGPKTMEALLGNIAAQTGLKFSHQTKMVDVWCMVDEPNLAPSAADAN